MQIRGGVVDETGPVASDTQASGDSQALPLGLVEEPGMDERIETLVDALWERGPSTVAELTASLGWADGLLGEVLTESETLGVLSRIVAEPHDIVDLA